MIQKPLSDDYRIIMDEIVPEVLARFTNKAGDYGDAWKLLGAKGQFSDINRKFWKLFNSIWEGRELQGEQPAECAEDIIGHCLLLLLILRQEGAAAPTPERALNSASESLVPPTVPGDEAGRLPGGLEAPVRPGERPERT